MYDDDSGPVLPIAHPEPPARPALTWTALAPLALPDLPEEIGRRLVEEHLLDPGRFWLPVPPPSVAATEPSFERDVRRLPRSGGYWRGPTWINSAWLVWLGLLRLGYDEKAGELARRVASTIGSQGLHEYYDPPPVAVSAPRCSRGRRWRLRSSTPTRLLPPATCLR